MNNNLSKEPLIFFIGKVVGFDEQEDQVKGGGWGWRYKVAIFDIYSSKESDIDDADIEYAIAISSNSDGSGGADRRRSMRISQGDTVIGLKYGGKRGIAFIIGIIPRTKNTVFGPNRYDTETGYYVSLQARGLFGSNQEFSECAGHETPEPTPKCTNKDKTVPAKKNEEKFNQLGLGDTENKKGQLKKPPGNELINSGTNLTDKQIRATVNAETANDRRNTNIDRSLDATLTRENALLDAALDAELDAQLAAAQANDPAEREATRQSLDF